MPMIKKMFWIEDGFTLRFVGIYNKIDMPLRVQVPTAPRTDVVEVVHVEFHLSSQYSALRMQLKRLHPGTPSYLS